MEKKTNEERKKGLKQKRKIERKHKKTRKETGNMCQKKKTTKAK